MRKFQVKANFQRPSSHQIKSSGKHKAGDASTFFGERDFEIFADDPDDAKIKVKDILKREGHYGERSLEHITWTVSRLDRPRKKIDP